MKRVLIVEDHEDMRLVYELVFRRIENGVIVGEAERADEAIQKVRDLKPDVAVVDISLPGMDGISLTKILHEEYPNMRILIATGHDTEDYRAAAIDAGADAYLVKGNAKAMSAKIRELME